MEKIQKKARFDFDYGKDILVVIEVGLEIFVDIYDADEVITSNVETKFELMNRNDSAFSLELKPYSRISTLMDILHRTSESVELEIAGNLSKLDSTFTEFSKVKSLRLTPERGSKFRVDPWIHSFAATSISIGDTFISKGGCVYIDCTLARDPVKRLFWDGKDVLKLLKIRYNLMSILCKGLDSWSGQWTTFLCKGLYDPRLLLHVSHFLG